VTAATHETAASETIGTILRRERELRAISLEEVAQTTRVPLRTLRALEEDDADALPAEVFVRGFLRAYARSLGLDERPLLERYEAGGEEPEAPPAIGSVGGPERGRRFGVAIAVVVLLILFTLALSIVLRPRQRDVPVELSHVDAPAQVLPTNLA